MMKWTEDDMKPQRIQFKRVKGWRKPPNTVMVCRPSRFGNPFSWQTLAVQDGYSPKAIACDEFEHWLRDKSPYGKMLPQSRQWIFDNLRQIYDADYVACYCGLDEPCHGDILIKLAMERFG